MKSTNTEDKIKLPLLSEEQTALFVESFKSACRSLNAKAVVALFEQFPIHNFEEKDTFIEEAYNILSFGPDHPAGIEVRSVHPFESRCSACTLGKIVSAYSVVYVQHNDTALPGRIIYERSFALNVTLKGNQLMDFGWCNFFLNQKEIEDLEL